MLNVNLKCCGLFLKLFISKPVKSAFILKRLNLLSLLEDALDSVYIVLLHVSIAVFMALYAWIGGNTVRCVEKTDAF